MQKKNLYPIVSILVLILLSALYISNSNSKPENIFSNEKNLNNLNSTSSKTFTVNTIGAIDTTGPSTTSSPTDSLTYVDKDTNLSESNFQGKDLSGIDFAGANLPNANFKGANLPNANFKGANLQGANFQNANLGGANLSESYLDGANLSGANLSGTNLNNIDLSLVNLQGLFLDKVDFSKIDLTGLNLSRVELTEADLSGKNLTNINLSDSYLGKVNFSGANLEGANLEGANLNNADFSGANLTNVNLSRTILNNVNLNNANIKYLNLKKIDLRGLNLSKLDLRGVDLSLKDLSKANLTGQNLSGFDLSNTNLSKSILTNVNLSKTILKGANLSYTDLSSSNLTGANLTGANLTGANLTQTTPQNAVEVIIKIQDTANSNWPKFSKIDKLNVTNFDISNDTKYLTTKEGFLYQLKNNVLKKVIDLNKNSNFPFASSTEGGMLSVVSKDDLVYLSYSSHGNNGDQSLIVDEYSSNFKIIRNIIKIDGFEKTHFGGNLFLDSSERLYLSVGDGEGSPSQESPSQNLNSFKGKILRLDTSELKLNPKIIAYGLRNPWGVSIDANDRMFILDCGWGAVESIYMLENVNPDIPLNLGWPVFQGTLKIQNNSLDFKNTLNPIYEYKERPGCVTGGFYLNDIESYVFGDFYGTIRLLKQGSDGKWYLFHEFKQEFSEKLEEISIINNAYKAELAESTLATNIWSLGLNATDGRIFIGPHNYELKIQIEPIIKN
jgi:uncharacterized protein YjbI with pentapeptide repeats